MGKTIMSSASYQHQNREDVLAMAWLEVGPARHKRWVVLAKNTLEVYANNFATETQTVLSLTSDVERIVADRNNTDSDGEPVFKLVPRRENQESTLLIVNRMDDVRQTDQQVF